MSSQRQTPPPGMPDSVILLDCLRKRRLILAGLDPDLEPCLGGDLVPLFDVLSPTQRDATVQRMEVQTMLHSEYHFAPRAPRPRQLTDGSLDYSRTPRSSNPPFPAELLPPIAHRSACDSPIIKPSSDEELSYHLC